MEQQEILSPIKVLYQQIKILEMYQPTVIQTVLKDGYTYFKNQGSKYTQEQLDVMRVIEMEYEEKTLNDEAALQSVFNEFGEPFILYLR